MQPQVQQKSHLMGLDAGEEHPNEPLMELGTGAPVDIRAALGTIMR